MGDKRIMCVGLVCVDIVNVVKHFPLEDTDQRNKDHRWHRGGNASNSCTVLSLLGSPCEYLGTIAVSPELSFIKENFETYGINIDHVVYHSNHSTPMSIVIVNSQNGSRTILHGNKGLPELTLEEFKKVDLSNRYQWIHFEGRPSSNEISRMLQHIDEYNDSLTDSSCRIKTSVELEKARPQLDILANLADVVFLSKDYAQYIGFKTKEEAVDSFIKKCRPGAIVICAWGEDGAAARTSDGSIFTSGIYPPEKVLDTLGAGDTFNAATIRALSQGKGVGGAIQYGCQVAGAKCGMNGFDGLREMFGNE